MMVDQFSNPELFLLQLWITCGFNGLLCMLCLFYLFFLLEKQLENRHPAARSLGSWNINRKPHKHLHYFTCGINGRRNGACQEELI